MLIRRRCSCFLSWWQEPSPPCCNQIHAKYDLAHISSCCRFTPLIYKFTLHLINFKMKKVKTKVIFSRALAGAITACGGLAEATISEATSCSLNGVETAGAPMLSTIKLSGAAGRALTLATRCAESKFTKFPALAARPARSRQVPQNQCCRQMLTRRFLAGFKPKGRTKNTLGLNRHTEFVNKKFPVDDISSGFVVLKCRSFVPRKPIYANIILSLFFPSTYSVRSFSLCRFDGC